MDDSAGGIISTATFRSHVHRFCLNGVLLISLYSNFTHCNTYIVHISAAAAAEFLPHAQGYPPPLLTILVPVPLFNSRIWCQVAPAFCARGDYNERKKTERAPCSSKL